MSYILVIYAVVSTVYTPYSGRSETKEWRPIGTFATKEACTRAGIRLSDKHICLEVGDGK